MVRGLKPHRGTVNHRLNEQLVKCQGTTVMGLQRYVLTWNENRGLLFRFFFSAENRACTIASDVVLAITKISVSLHSCT